MKWCKVITFFIPAFLPFFFDQPNGEEVKGPVTSFGEFSQVCHMVGTKCPIFVTEK